VQANIHRALSALGYVCEYGCGNAGQVDWTEEVSSQGFDLVPPEELTWHNSLVACYRVFRRYLMKDNIPTTCASFRALAGLFSSQPRLMLLLEEEQLLDSALSGEAALRLTVLQCLRRILMVRRQSLSPRRASSNTVPGTHLVSPPIHAGGAKES
jgi:hypothetical protein